MARPILATDFKDDIMQDTMNGKRRYRMVNNTDGTVSFEDATDYEQVGNSYGAGQINATNEAVNQSVDSNKLVKELSTISAITKEGYVPDALAVKELNSSLGTLSFAQDENGNWGYRVGGADTVTPFKSGINIVKLGSGLTSGSISVKNYDGWEKFTTSNFYWQNVQLTIQGGYGAWRDYSLSYDNSTGICSYSLGAGNKTPFEDWWVNASVSGDLYLIY